MEIRTIPHQHTWPIRHAVMWPNKPLAYIKLPEDESGTHFGLFLQDRLVAVVSVFIHGHEAQFRKLATMVPEQGKGYGTLLLQHLFEYLKQQNATKVWCNARANATSFYRKFGMVSTPKKFKKGGLDYVVMERFL